MKQILINENIEESLISDILCEAFYPTSDKVLYIKDYLDKNFARQSLDDIDANGYPIKERTAVMLSADKQPLKTFSMSEFLVLLDDKFHSMIADDNDRRKFLKQVIRDWYMNNISKNGLLSVNHL